MPDDAKPADAPPATPAAPEPPPHVGAGVIRNDGSVAR